MRYFLTAALLLASALTFGSYGGSFPNLYTPASGISEGDFEFFMNHRFFGAALKDDPFDSFFGLDDGANVNVGIRFFPTEVLYFGFEHTRLAHAHTLFAGWESTLTSMNIGLAARAGYTSAKPFSNEDREGGMVATMSLSAWFLGDRLRPVFNYAFDGNQDESGMGFGLEIAATEKISLMGEYFPSSADGSEEDCYSISSRYTTWGHQFILGLGNSLGIGPQGQIMGSSTGDLSILLSIRRLI